MDEKSEKYIMSLNTPLTYFDSGNSLPVQRGTGIGQIFSSMYNSIVPLVKSAMGLGKRVIKSEIGQKAVKSIKKRAMDAGLNVVNDALQGENILESTKSELKKAGGKVIEDVMKPTKRPTAAKKKMPRAKRRRKQGGRGFGKDIFS